MKEPGPILCPVDFGSYAGRGLRMAAHLAGVLRVPLHALYVSSFEAPPYFTARDVEDLQIRFREASAGAEGALQTFVAESLGPAGGGVVSRVIEGNVFDGITQAVRDVGAGLVVMGTHGRRGVNRWMLGSVAERVIRESQVPVVTVREEPPSALRHILCPVNDTPASRAALEWAARLAVASGGILTVLHVREPGAGAFKREECAWLGPDVGSKCEWREMTREGDAAAQILTLTRELPADLLVLGSRHRAFLDTAVIGTTTVRAVRHAPCAVLTVTASTAAGAA